MANKDNEKKKEVSTSDDLVGRRWTQLLHEDTLFTNRVNFFLVAESMLFVSYVTAINALQPNKVVIHTIAILGVVYTIIWWFVCGRQQYNLEKLKEKVEEVDPDYKDTRIGRAPGPATFVLAHILPAVTLIAWIVMLHAMS